MSSLMVIIMTSDIYKKHQIYYNEIIFLYLVVRDGKFLRLKGHYGFDSIKDLYEKLESSNSYKWEDLPSYSYFTSRKLFKLFKEFNNWEEFKSFPETHPEYFI